MAEVRIPPTTLPFLRSTERHPGRRGAVALKYHLIVKLRRTLAADLAIPEWVAFIADKSVVHRELDGVVDRILRNAGLDYWVTREFRPAGGTWSADEHEHGLDRTYRIILADDADDDGDALAQNA